MGEVIFQAYACFWMCFIIFWLLKPRYSIRKDWWRFAGVYGAWFLMDMVEWQATRAAMVFKSFEVYAIRSVLRFFALYLFLYLIHRLCYGRFAKIFFATFLGEAIFVMGYVVVQVLLLPIQSPGEAFLTFDSDSVYTVWVLILLTPLLPLLLYLLRKPRKLYQRLDIGKTMAEKVVAAALLLVIGSGYILNREEMADYGSQAFFTAIFLIVGNFTCWAVLIWSDYQVESQKNRYLKLRQEILREHERTLREQMEFSRKLQAEIKSQLDTVRFPKEAGKDEVERYYSRLEALAKPKEKTEYFRDPVLDSLTAGQLKAWEEKGVRTEFENRLGPVSKTEAADLAELLSGLFGAADGLKLEEGKTAKLSLSQAVGRCVLELELWEKAGKASGKKLLRRLGKVKELARQRRGRVKVKAENGRIRIRVDMEKEAETGT